MKKLIGVAALLGLVATGAFATSAYAKDPVNGACGVLGSGVLIDYDNGWSWEAPTNVVNNVSTSGSAMTAVGTIVFFCPPLYAPTDPQDPLKEYTFVINATSSGTVASPYGPTLTGTIWDTDYTGGTFSIYEGSPRNTTNPPAANPPNATVPLTFADGTVILSGVFDTFHTAITRSNPTAFFGSSVRADYRFTGGTLFNLVGGGPALFQGLWCPGGSGSGRCTVPAGYANKSNAKWDSPGTTETQSSTWGAIKQLYR